jgi:hypothetical protein
LPLMGEEVPQRVEGRGVVMSWGILESKNGRIFNMYLKSIV